MVEDARYRGPHTGTWRDPSGVEIPATERKLDFSFVGVFCVGVFRVEDGKISAIRI